MDNENGHVVVGIDGSESSDHALAWAVAEAGRRQRPLHLVHARAVDDFWLATGAPVPRELVDAPDVLLDEAVARARKAAPTLEITAESGVGHATATLLSHSDEAAVVVVGARGRGPAAQWLLGSVSAQVSAHAASPVVVVRGTAGGDAGESVVVGVDGSPSSVEAVGFALEQAAARSLPLVAVASFEALMADGVPLGPEQSEKMAQQREEAVAAALAPWRDTYQGVDIRERIVRARPVDALLDAAAGAALVVVGSRGLGGFRGLLLGSVSRSVLAHATVPVAVVPNSATSR